ncbi:hypothetical protein RN001_012263 [Aquatica leii]|uniref:Uncharacterized protein n=1 Tax=Aquatica leii TaxID=1421715 RepID=A0AAN7P727_9COLE|nr:hypothetical protein RN001_012263 [Aquatica leii]
MVFPHTFRTEHSETRTTSSMYGEYYVRTRKKKIKIQPELLKVIRSIDFNRMSFLKNLEEIISIPSISGNLKYVDDIAKAIKLTENWMVKLGIKHECFEIGSYTLEDKKLMRPTIILGTLGNDSTKPTIGVYAHLDVKMTDKANWKTDPWSLTELDQRLYGCGVASGKGTLMSWFNLIIAFQNIKMSLPVNLKFIIQSLHYYNSEGFEDFIARKRQGFLSDITYIVICDSEWLGDKHPCLVYGSVGLLHFTCTMNKNDQSDRCMKEDMKKIFEKLHDGKGNVLIPEFNDYIKQITPDEESVYESIEDFDIEEVRDSLPEHQKSWDKLKLLMSFWRLPSIFVEDTLECTCEDGDKSKIKKNFIIKIVPRQIVDVTKDQIIQHFKNSCKDLGVQHKVDVQLTSASRTWLEDINSLNLEAARKAIIQIYKDDPNMIREDRDLKIVNTLSVISEKSILVLPLGDKHIRAGEDNENMPKKNFYEGIKLLGAYLFQVAALLQKE